MNEKQLLLSSIATSISTYRFGEIPLPNVAHVEKWANQFSEENIIPFLREFSLLIKSSFILESSMNEFLTKIIENEGLTKGNAVEFWNKSNFLQIQKKGQSQKEMLKLFGGYLKESYKINLSDCGSVSGDFIYLDDIIFTGQRVATDLEYWITHSAPNNSILHIIVIAYHTSGHYYLQETKLKSIIANSGKNIKINFWRAVVLENRKYYKDTSDVLWPNTIPDDEHTQSYMQKLRYPFEPRTNASSVGAAKLFSTPEGREVLETEFLRAGTKILSNVHSTSTFNKPLGCGQFGLGFGSTIVTYRNCPNNTPLALWWGSINPTEGALDWYPLLPRKTYSSIENIFNGIDFGL
ncbi:phosphoribosyltransferase-like protein [Shewanella frigidimarina]|jgi:hypothetical protein|uniref:phosphoribosyltransferase-like protein n=1 Tax=Shewanella frigidimarina TaxID=56812 RepID=UPI003D7A2B86